MAQHDDKLTGYRTPHEGPPSTVPADAPREALGRRELPVVGPVDLELALGRPLRLDLDAEILDIEPGSALIARAPDLPTVELRRLRIDLVHGTVVADADAIGPFMLRTAGLALRVVLRRAFGWQPGRSLLDHLAQNLPQGPWTGERRLWSGPARTALSLHPDAHLAAQVRGDQAELVLTRPALLRVLGVALPILAVRLVFGRARLEIDPGPAGPVRRAILRLLAWIATGWLRRRMPAAMTIPGYDLLADEQRRSRLLELVRRLRGRERPRRGPVEHVPHDMAAEQGLEAQVPPAAPNAGLAAALAELAALRLGAAAVPPDLRVLARIPLGARGEAVLVTGRDADLVVTKSTAGLRVDAPGGVYLLADALPELAELRLSRAVVTLDESAGVHFDVQTDPPLGPLLRALVRRIAHRELLPRVPLALLRSHGLVHERGAGEHVLLRQRFSATAGLVLRTELDAEIELHHGAAALVVSCPAGLRIAFEGLPFLPDAVVRRLEYRWSDGSVSADSTPDLGDFGALALGQLVRVRAAPVLPPILGFQREGGPGIDPLLADQFPALLLHTDLAVLGGLDVRIDPDDVLRARLAPLELALDSARAIALLAPDLRLALKIRRVRHGLAEHESRVECEPALGDYLTQLVGRCVELFGLPPLRPHLPLWPVALPDQPWRLAQVPRASEGPRAHLDLPAGAGLLVERSADALEIRADAPLRLTPEGTPLIAEFAVNAARYTPAAAEIELTTDPPAGALVHEALRRAFARYVPQATLAQALARAAMPRPGATPPPLPPPPGVLVWEKLVANFGALRVSLDPARTVDVTLQRRGARLAFGAGASLRAVGLGLCVTVEAVDLSFLPWTVEVTTRPAAGELEQQLVSHALRALFTEFMRYFWPSDRSPRAGHDTLLALGADQPWGPLKICVARGGSIELHLGREGVSLRSAAGLFVTGEAIDWLPDFYLHELGLRPSDAAVKLAISGIEEQAYHEAAPVSPITEAVLSHLFKVLVAPKIPPAWSERLGLPRLPLPPPLALDPSRVVVFGAELPGGHGPLLVSMDAGDAITVRASAVEVAIESERGLVAAMPGLRLALQLRGARYHIHTGEVQVGGLGQLENALIEAVLRRQLAASGAGASGVQGLLDRFPLDAAGRRVLFQHPLVNMSLQTGTMIRLRLDDAGLHIDAEPALAVDGPGKLNFSVCGLRYSFADARFSVDVGGDSTFADLFEGIIDRHAEKRMNDLLLPLLPAAMRTPGYRLTTDPHARDNIAELMRAFARKPA